MAVREKASLGRVKFAKLTKNAWDNDMRAWILICLCAEFKMELRVDEFLGE